MIDEYILENLTKRFNRAYLESDMRKMEDIYERVEKIEEEHDMDILGVEAHFVKLGMKVFIERVKREG
jgi:hypothetical protein